MKQSVIPHRNELDADEVEDIAHHLLSQLRIGSLLALPDSHRPDDLVMPRAQVSDLLLHLAEQAQQILNYLRAVSAATVRPDA